MRAFSKTAAWLLSIFLLGSFELHAQPFSDLNVNFGVTIYYGDGYAPSGVAADFNSDGAMDLFIECETGSGPQDPVWLNNGNNTVTDTQDLYTNRNNPFSGIFSGSCAGADFFNKGRIDVLFNGINSASSPATTWLWQNLGGASFIFDTNSGLLPTKGHIAIGDFDNGGKLDIALTGVSFNATHASVARNLGAGIFTNVVTGITATGPLPIFFADFDGDGYVDLLVGAVLWRNLGNGTFTNIASGLPGSALAVGDFDNNGTLDVLITNGTYQIWYNQGNGTFTNSNISLPTVSTPTSAYPPAAAVGDYDNDGLLDIVLTSGDFFDPASVQVWRNQGNGTFTNTQSVVRNDVNGPFKSLVMWFDFTQDSRLDLLMVSADGMDQYGNTLYHPHIWQNVSSCPTSFPPTAPTNLTWQTFPNGGVKMMWGAATDDHTPSSGLNYNIRVGTTSGGVDIVSPEADPVTGRRLVVQLGNAYERLFSLLTNLSGGTYYWSVQAIDTAFAGGAFATESTFTIAPRITNFNLQTNGQFQLGFNALATNSYTLQASTDFLAWTNIANVIPATNGPAQLMDTNMPLYPWRYYRVKCP